MKSGKIGWNGIILLAALVAVIVLIVLLSTGSSAERADIQTLSDLSGRDVGVQAGTLYELEFLEQVPDANIVYYSDPYSMILALEQGKLDAMLDEDISYTIVESKNHPMLVSLEEPVGTYDTAAAFGETDRKYELYDQFNVFLRECKEDGTLDEMYDYWFTNYSSDVCTVDRGGITGENGMLSVCVETTYEPFEYLSSGEYQGFDIDLIYRFARKYGYQPEITGLDFDAISPALAAGKYDMGMNLIPEEERADSTLFSDPYTQFHIIAVVASGEAEQAGVLDSVAESFRKTFIVDSRWKLFVEGLLITLLISVLSIIFGFILGTVTYMLCYDGDPLANGIMNVLCELFGGLPSVVLLMILYYIVFSNLTLTNVAVSVIAFTLLFTCSVFSIIKVGVEALGDGQYEAARAQGFTSHKTFLYIIYPQVLINQLPTLQDEINSLIKETSVVGYIAVTDLTKMSDIVRGRTFEPFFPLIVTAIIYYIIIKLLTSLVALAMRSINIETRHPEKMINQLKENSIS